jgi:hypothetical protein
MFSLRRTDHTSEGAGTSAERSKEVLDTLCGPTDLGEIPGARWRDVRQIRGGVDDLAGEAKDLL